MTFPLAWRSAALLLLVATSALADPATPCDAEMCALPDCSCSSTNTPGGLLPEDIPHFVLLSFDDDINVINHPFYQTLQERQNPNGCNIQMTFFVSHENTDYNLVNDMYLNHHEIAVHSVTHKADIQNYWRNLTEAGWLAEIQQQKEMLELYAKIPADAITGFRSPFLELGGDAMFGALQEVGLTYDCSWPSVQYTPWYPQGDGSSLGALWPYTLDYSTIQELPVGTPPTEAFPGFWEVPMTDLEDNRGIQCSMLDACQSTADGEMETSAAAVTDFLTRNFLYSSDARTPLGVYAHYGWFYYETHRTGMVDFLDSLAAYPEVYVVSVSQMLDWVRHPVPLSELGTLESFQCGDVLPDTDCTESDNIECVYQAPLPVSTNEVYFNICQGPCPDNYPYLNNVDGSLSYPLGGSKT